jgi:hypothetical protein
MIKNERNDIGRVKGYGYHQLGKGRNMRGKPFKNNAKHKNKQVQKKTLQTSCLDMCTHKKK